MPHPASDVIIKEYKHSVNFMTPAIIGYGWLVDDKIAYELSTGRGFSNKPIFGVSVAKLNADGTTERMPDLSGCFQSKHDALVHIGRLRADLKREEGS